MCVKYKLNIRMFLLCLSEDNSHIKIFVKSFGIEREMRGLAINKYQNLRLFLANLLANVFPKKLLQYILKYCRMFIHQNDVGDISINLNFGTSVFPFLHIQNRLRSTGESFFLRSNRKINPILSSCI